MKITESQLKKLVMKKLNEQAMPTWTHFVVDAIGWEDEGGVLDNEDQSLSDYHGKRIYELQEEAFGYYNITMSDGVKFYAISTMHIKAVK